MAAVDVARGLLMLYIVLVIHGLFWLKLLPEAISSLLLFEMPAIFLLSGYAYYLAGHDAKAGDRRQQLLRYPRYLQSRMTRILVPYLVYAAVCAAISSAVAVRTAMAPHDFGAIALSWLNPFTYGRYYSAGMLNWQLWFVPTFL
ncbi:MAG: hypothetical protein JWQ72_3122, partial [Polaromonas sp.]|nr:hypothetical protein [Polaromonas sp.]